MTDLFKEEKKEEYDRHVNELNARLSLMKDWKDTFSSPHGRRVLMDILDSTFMHDTVFTGNSRTYYNAAFQDYGKKILDTIALADPETYVFIHTQRVKELKKDLENEIDSVKKIEAGRQE